MRIHVFEVLKEKTRKVHFCEVLVTAPIPDTMERERESRIIKSKK